MSKDNMGAFLPYDGKQRKKHHGAEPAQHEGRQNNSLSSGAHSPLPPPIVKKPKSNTFRLPRVFDRQRTCFLCRQGAFWALASLFQMSREGFKSLIDKEYYWLVGLGWVFSFI